MAVEDNRKDIFFYLLSKGGEFVTQTRKGQPTRVDPGILEEFFLQKCIKFDASKNTLELVFEVFDDKDDKSDRDQVKGKKNTEKDEGALEMKDLKQEGAEGKLDIENEVTATM